MKIFKKSLAVVLAMVMLLCALPMVAVGAKSYPTLALDTPTYVTVDDYAHYKFVPKSDGYYRFYSIGDWDVCLSVYDSEWDYIGYSDDTFYDEEFSLNFDITVFLSAGETYYLEMGNWEDTEINFQVVAEIGVGPVSVEITQMPYDTTCIEGFENATVSFDGLEAEFTMSDGSVVSWNYEEEYMIGDFLVNVYVKYDYETDEYVNYGVIECENAYAEFPLTVVENSVDYLEYSSDTDIVCYENSCGCYDEDFGYYIYNTSVPEDAVITVHYKDGTSVEVSVMDTVDGSEFWIEDSQFIAPWTVDGDNYIEISYLGVGIKIPVTIIPCPFESVTVDSAPTKEYIFGDFNYGYLYDDETYWFYPNDLTGLSFTVEYADGTTQTYTDADIDMDNYTIDGYPYELNEIEVTQAGAVEFTLNYKGAEICYEVNVIESNIESIEVLKAPDKTDYEGWFYPDYTGIQIKLNYKDGTSAVATANEDTLSYDNRYGEIVYVIRVGDDIVRVYPMYDYDFETDRAYDLINCVGASLYYDGINYGIGKTVEEISVENFSKNGDGMVVTVAYEDGTEDVLTYDVISYYVQEDDYCAGCAMTENGIIGFSVEEYDDGYYFYTLGEELFVEKAVDVSVLGDVDGDGIITVLDATAIQCHLASLKTLNEQQLSVSDTDKDGIVTVLDATRIQKFKAQLIDEL